MHIHDKLLPWNIAQLRKCIVSFLTIPLQVSEEFWKTWIEVYYPSGHQ